jgi:hypothetical protein
MAINGNNVGIYVEGTLIGCLTNASFSSTNQEIDVTCKDNSGARAILPGGNQAEITFEGFFDPAATYGLQDLMTVHTARTRSWVKMEYVETDALAVTGYAYLNTLEWTGPLNAGSTFSGTFTMDGGYTFTIT